LKNKILRVLCACLLLLLLPQSVWAKSDGSFVLAAVTANEILIAPTEITYKSGDTVADALLSSGYRFEGLETGNIYTIEGVAGSFCRYMDYTDPQGRNYALDTDAENVGCLFICTSSKEVPEVFPLLRRMAEYSAMSNGVALYGPARTAYTNCRNGLRNISSSGAEELLGSLNSAIAAYEELRQGTKYPVSFSVTQNGITPALLQITLTDAYGQSVSGSGETLSVIVGDYSFVLSDGGVNRTEGRLTVGPENPNPIITASLPYGQWFGELRLSRSTGTAFEDKRFPLLQCGESSTVFEVEDCFSGSPILYVGIGAVPDENKTILRTVYTDLSGKDQSGTSRSWESKTLSLASLLEPGMTDRELTLEGRYTDSSGYTQIQTHSLKLQRSPTLKSITLLLPDGSEHFCQPGFSAVIGEYSCTVFSSSLSVSAEAFGSEGYSVEGCGSINTQSDTELTLRVSHSGGRERTYHFSIYHSAAANVRFNVPGGCTLAVYDGDEHRVNPRNDGSFDLLPGTQYHYVCSKNDYSHASASFTASDGLTVSAAEPKNSAPLRELALYDKSSYQTRRPFLSPDDFAPSRRTASVTVPDASSILYVQATAAEGYGVTAVFGSKTVVINNAVSDTGACQPLSSCLSVGGYSRCLTIRCSLEENGVRYYEDTAIQIRRSAHLKTLSLASGSDSLELLDAAGNKQSFNRERYEYWVELSNDEASLTLTLQYPGSEGYSLKIGEQCYTDSPITLPLEGESGEELLTLTVCHEDESSIRGSYTLHLIRKTPVQIRFDTEPADALVYILNNKTGKRVFTDAENTADLIPGGSYSYTVSAAGYRAVQNASYTVPESNGSLSVTLLEAVGSEHRSLSAQWPAFRADENNNGVVTAFTPTVAEDTALYWATKLGEGYDSGAVGCPILVDGYIYTYSGNSIFKLDTVSGEVVARGNMDHASSFAINNPSYAEGMIFVGLSDGGVQAFDASTLEPLWLYTDPLGGQPNCPITVSNGYLYTGFWNGDSLSANFVCMSLTDEDPALNNEPKLASWRYTVKGGFYWAGAYACENYLLVGSDDGQSGNASGYASLFSLNPRTGALIDSITLPHTGDIRSSVTMVGSTAYFTSNGGYFYAVDVAENGELGELRYLRLENGSGTAGCSSSTPVIYNGRAYVGVCGSVRFEEYSGHNITVIDLSGWSIAYSVPTQGFPQTSGLLSVQGDGVYVYFFDNYTPGKLRCLHDRSGQTQADVFTTESYTLRGVTTEYSTAYVLFTPTGTQAQYAICSPICDAYGTLYFKNDSAQLMALGSTIEKIEIVQQPEKLNYTEGESFDPTGMTVCATYANGAVRDVTAYVSWSDKPLTAEDTEFEIRFEHILYHNSEGESGVVCDSPYVYIRLTMSEADHSGDIDGNGEIDNADAALVYAAANGVQTLTGEALERGDLNGNGEADSEDASAIYEHYLNPTKPLKGGKTE